MLGEHLPVILAYLRAALPYLPVGFAGLAIVTLGGLTLAAEVLYLIGG